ncbi:MAG: hypothetical protein CMB32_05425 [Euryarchaeota archaeon]|nr:hypothetical protein [Euryarchaeota archaeon]
MKIAAQILRSTLFLLLICQTQLTFAQDWLDEEEGWGPRRRGIEFGLNMGVYQANNGLYTSSANFYNGDGYFELGDNTATLYSIEERMYLGTTDETIQNMLNVSSFEIPYDAYSLNMMYNPSMLFGLKMVGFFNPEAAIVLAADVASLKAKGAYTINAGTIQPGQNTNTRVYGVFGEERRMMTMLGFRTSFYITDRSSWVFEFGEIMTATRIERNYFNVEQATFDLITQFNGPGNFNGPTSNLTNFGFGQYATIGLEALFEEGGNLEANFRLSRDRIKLGSQEEDFNGDVKGYNMIQWNFALYVTWMIPPHIGDFVRASF